jgi:hypothetical protein
MAAENIPPSHGHYELREESATVLSSDLSKLDLSQFPSFDEWIQHADSELRTGASSQSACSSCFHSFDFLLEQDAQEGSGSKSRTGPREEKRRVQNREA